MENNIRKLKTYTINKDNQLKIDLLLLHYKKDNINDFVDYFFERHLNPFSDLFSFKIASKYKSNVL